MSENSETQHGTIAQKLKEAFNQGEGFKHKFSICVGCKEWEYENVPSTMTIGVTLTLQGKEKSSQDDDNRGRNPGSNELRIELERKEEDKNGSAKSDNNKATFRIACDTGGENMLRMSARSSDLSKTMSVKFSGNDDTAVSVSFARKKTNREDIVQHLYEQISTYWTAHVDIQPKGSFTEWVRKLWPCSLDRSGIIDQQDLTTVDKLDFACALAFVVVFRGMIIDVLCTQPQPDPNDLESDQPDGQSDEKGTSSTLSGTAKTDDKFVWDTIANLREIIGETNDYLQKITKICLGPETVTKELEKKRLTFSDTVIDQVCSALSSGGHLILTGLPGCGKTCLAEALAEAAGLMKPIVATANPCWSTDDLIGRYMPAIAPGEGKGTVLEFKEGFFLKAISNRTWLIIDEFNRAPIDSCFGELFTVLSGKRVDLPFRTSDDKTISIVPEKTSNGSKKTAEQSLDLRDDDSVDRYVMRENFRIIGTMNDVDSVSLNALSFALQRRFYIVHVDMPVPAARHDVFDKSCDEVLNEYKSALTNPPKSKEWGKKLTKDIVDIIAKLFAKDDQDFVSKEIVGMAQPKDIIRSAVSRMFEKCVEGWKLRNFNNDDNMRKEYLMSGIAMGIVMKVYPQLVNRPKLDDLKWVPELLKSVFGECRLRLRPAQSDDSDDRLIVDYLRDEFLRCFAHSPKAKDVWPKT